MRTTGFAFGFALLFGVAVYGGIAWIEPKPAPASCLDVVGLLALADAAVGRLAAPRTQAPQGRVS